MFVYAFCCRCSVELQFCRAIMLRRQNRPTKKRRCDTGLKCCSHIPARCCAALPQNFFYQRGAACVNVTLALQWVRTHRAAQRCSAQRTCERPIIPRRWSWRRCWCRIRTKETTSLTTFGCRRDPRPDYAQQTITDSPCFLHTILCLQPSAQLTRNKLSK